MYVFTIDNTRCIKYKFKLNPIMFIVIKYISSNIQINNSFCKLSIALNKNKHLYVTVVSHIYIIHIIQTLYCIHIRIIYNENVKSFTV